MARGQHERAMSCHLLCKSMHERVGLYMKISKHFVGLPLANEMNDVGVDSGAK